MKITTDWQVAHEEDHTSEPPGNSEIIESSESHRTSRASTAKFLKECSDFCVHPSKPWRSDELGGYPEESSRGKEAKEFIESLELQPGDLQLRDSGENQGGELSVYLSIAGGPVGKSSGVEFSDYTLDYSLAVIVDEKKGS